MEILLNYWNQGDWKMGDLLTMTRLRLVCCWWGLNSRRWMISSIFFQTTISQNRGVIHKGCNSIFRVSEFKTNFILLDDYFISTSIFSPSSLNWVFIQWNWDVLLVRKGFKILSSFEFLLKQPEKGFSKTHLATHFETQNPINFRKKFLQNKFQYLTKKHSKFLWFLDLSSSTIILKSLNRKFNNAQNFCV